MAEFVSAGEEESELIDLPVAAREFGRKKLNVTPMKTAILADRNILQMLGVDQGGHAGSIALDLRLKRFVQTIAREIEEGQGVFEEFRPILEMIARNHNPAWLLIARLYEENDAVLNLEKARESYRRFLENEPASDDAAAAWRQLAHLAYHDGDTMEEINALIERSQISTVPFAELSSTANRFNQTLHSGDLQLTPEERRIVGERLLLALELRKAEATADDFSRFAWLALNLGKTDQAEEYVNEGVSRGGDSHHIDRLRERLEI